MRTPTALTHHRQGWLPLLWRGERHLVFQRNGVLVGEHDLPEIDVRQDMVLKHRNKRKKGDIDDEFDNLLLRGLSQLSHVSLDVCAAGGGGSDGEVLEHLRRRPAGKGSGSQGGDNVGGGRRQVSKAGLWPEPRGDRSD